MPNAILMSLSALAALVPATVWSFKGASAHRDGTFWAVAAAAAAGPATISVVQLFGTWQSSLSLALWMTVTTSMALFIGLSIGVREGWRLMPLVAPYLLLLGILATLGSNAASNAPPSSSPDAWLLVHIVASVTTYGLCTLAAVAGVAVLLQERAIKRKQPNALTHRLPSVADASRLQGRLLAASAVVLALGIVTGMAEQYLTSGQALVLDHKTLLSILAFAVIGFLLILHRRSGLRGQHTARLILVAYLLLTLAYPGVKFVTGILLV